MDKDIRTTEELFKIQQREWKALRMFWVIMGLVIAAAAFGLFGKGMLSDKVYTANNVQIEYHKFMRVGKDTEIYIHTKDLGQHTSIGINNDYLKKVRITQVVPEPASVEVKDNTLIYKFSSVKNGFVTVFLSPQTMGSQQLEITVGNNKMRFNQYIYF